jgi:hypothetical protein
VRVRWCNNLVIRSRHNQYSIMMHKQILMWQKVMRYCIRLVSESADDSVAALCLMWSGQHSSTTTEDSGLPRCVTVRWQQHRIPEDLNLSNITTRTSDLVIFYSGLLAPTLISSCLSMPLFPNWFLSFFSFFRLKCWAHLFDERCMFHELYPLCSS